MRVFVTTMKRKLLAWCVVFVLLAAGIRFLQANIHSYIGGRSSNSPDGRFRAYADTHQEERFCGGQHNFYEFKIESRGRYIRRSTVEEPEHMADWRNGQIQWAKDSSAVSFLLPDQNWQLVLNVNPAAPPSNGSNSTSSIQK